MLTMAVTMLKTFSWCNVTHVHNLSLVNYCAETNGKVIHFEDGAPETMHCAIKYFHLVVKL